MLILLPPSEGKAQRGRGRPIDLARLSFPELAAARDHVLDALATTSARPDALVRLTAPPGAAQEVERNARIREIGTLPAERLYTGVLYDALDLESMEVAARRRARRWVVVTSALFGAVRLADPLPPYRLPVCASLDGLDSPAGLEAYWRRHLPDTLTEAAGRGVVVDCRSSSYVPLWRPTAELADRWVQIRVPGASHSAKHTRGLVTRHLCVAGSLAKDVPAVAQEIGAAFDVALHEPARPGKPWVLDVHPSP
ncbi:YaaA family protein [Pseudactinotalea suaedae]|uniref:YaaA family protein n=1 Tax=Pseudactinotalea suaedae TaxID=1524924 RepID=UPI0012E16589|nr:peroxide stress protein YaaA [Pseudactinotalea suaedae]